MNKVLDFLYNIFRMLSYFFLMILVVEFFFCYDLYSFGIVGSVMVFFFEYVGFFFYIYVMLF